MAFYKYPPSSGGGSSSNASVGTSGSAVPTSSTLVAGKDPTGLLKPLNVDASGDLNLNVVSSALPTGASTSALQTTGNTSLSSIDGKTPALGQALAASSVPVVLPSAQVTALTPPTSVAVTQATGTNLHAVIDSGAVSATQSGTWNVTNVSGTVSLPTGAATSANQSTAISSLSTIATNTTGVATAANQATEISSLASIVTNSSATQGSASGGTAASKSDLAGGIYHASLPTLTDGQQSSLQLDSSGRQIMAPLQTGSNVIGQVAQSGNWVQRLADGIGNLISSITQGTRISLSTQTVGRSIVTGTPIRNDYTVTNVTTSAYVQLIASTAAVTNRISIFDSSGQTLALAVGASGSEVIQCYIFPGGNGQEELYIPGGSRVAIKAISANATVGELDINFYQ